MASRLETAQWATGQEPGQARVQTAPGAGVLEGSHRHSQEDRRRREEETFRWAPGKSAGRWHRAKFVRPVTSPRRLEHWPTLLPVQEPAGCLAPMVPLLGPCLTSHSAPGEINIASASQMGKQRLSQENWCAQRLPDHLAELGFQLFSGSPGLLERQSKGMLSW